MATSRKASTSKTARVMNLLSKNREEPMEPEIAAPEQQDAHSPAPVAPPPAAAPAPVSTAAANTAPAVPENAAPAAPVAPPAPVHHSSTPPIISSMQADSAISNQVLSALENALDDELRAAQPEAKIEIAPAVEVSATEPAPAPAVQDSSPSEPASVPAVQESAEAAPEDVLNDTLTEAITQITEAEEAVVEAAESPMIHIPEGLISSTATAENTEPPHPPTRFPIDDTTIYVNVMEALVEEKAAKYMDMFGLCQCHRCTADVKALALNRLDPKYVVMHKGEEIPRISLYEGKFSAAVTAQLLSACKIVMENPRHDR